jgi:hypothetical protein
MILVKPHFRPVWPAAFEKMFYERHHAHSVTGPRPHRRRI